MKDIVIGVVLIIAGGAIVRLRLRLARDAVAYQNKTFGFHFGEKEIHRTLLLNLLIGFLLIIIGILAIIGIFEFK